MKYLYLQAFSDVDGEPVAVLFPLQLPELKELVRNAELSAAALTKLGGERVAFNVGPGGYPDMEPIWINEGFIDPGAHEPDWELEEAVDFFEDGSYSKGIVELTVEPWELAEMAEDIKHPNGVYGNDSIEDRELLVYNDGDVRFEAMWTGNTYGSYGLRSTAVSLQTLEELLAPLLEK